MVHYMVQITAWYRTLDVTQLWMVQSTGCYKLVEHWMLQTRRDVSDAKISRSADADAYAIIRARRSADANADANIWNIINTTSH